MCGRATVATEESSTTMKVDSMTDAAIIHGLAAGFQSWYSAAAPCAACSEPLNGRSRWRTRIVCR